MSLAEPESFVISEPSGRSMMISRREAEAILRDLQGDDDLSPALSAVRAQLEEFLS